MKTPRIDDAARLLSTPMGRRRFLALMFGVLTGYAPAGTRGDDRAERAPCVPESQSELCGTQTCGLARNRCGDIVSCGACAEGARCVLGVCTSACFEGDQPGEHLPCVPTPEKCARGLELLGGVDLRECDLAHADLHDANLRNADLRFADLHECNLSGAGLSMAFLSGAFLWRADLSGARLHFTEVIDTNLMETRIAGADLTSADLRGSCLEHADLTGANLRDARFEDANVHGVQWDGATCPDGTVAPSGGTCCEHLNGDTVRLGCGN